MRSNKNAGGADPLVCARPPGPARRAQLGAAAIVLIAVAGQAAIAIENARLMSETLEMKRTLEARKLVERAKGLRNAEREGRYYGTFAGLNGGMAERFEP